MFALTDVIELDVSALDGALVFAAPALDGTLLVFAFTALDGTLAFAVTSLDDTLVFAVIVAVAAVAFAAPALDVSALDAGPVLTFAFTIFLLDLRFPFLHLTLSLFLCFEALHKLVVLASSEALRFVCSCRY